MRTKKALILLCMLCSTLFTVAQTNVSGGIYSNTTWLKANNPYVVIGNVTVFPGVNLTLQPGVVIKFNNGTKLDIRGSLTSKGTPIDTIVFTSSSASPTMSIWDGVLISNDLGGSAEFKYSAIEYADKAITNVCCWNGGPLNIKRSVFRNNQIAVGGYAGWVVNIDSSMFTNNKYTIIQADKRIKNSTFKNNYVGIGDETGVERISVFNSLFCNNTKAVDFIQTDSLMNCTLVNNKVAYKSFINASGSNVIENNAITDNDTGIVSGSNLESIVNNTICNTYKNVVYLFNANKTMINNCWCTTFTSTIANKIHDGYDNVNYGLINFIPLTSCDSTAKPVVVNCTDIITGMSNYPTPPKPISLKMYPNPFNDYFVVTSNTTENDLVIKIYNMLGQEVKFIEGFNGRAVIDGKEMSEGVYFMQLIQKNIVIDQLKLIKN
ncbi:MAG: T9SS type A sorting domain-containing protein [Bacteroidetes bacterium]|nr:T9SS type A sorting domain-containing protein [Bacteroidota bacterium]